MEYTVTQLCWFFFAYSFFGWCAGVVLNALQKRRFVNTGFLALPLCPSYGIGAVLFCIFLTDLRNNIFFLFVAGSVIAAGVTVVTGIILERFFHRKWWDYSKNRFQFEGYINAWHLLLFGGAAVLILKAFNPILLMACAWIPRLAGNMILMAAGILMAIDFAVALVAVLQLKIQLHRMARVTESMEKVTDEIGNALTGKIQKRMLRAYPNLKSAQITENRAQNEASPVFASGCCFFKLFWLFLIGAFLGDITETVFCRYTMGYWMSRSSVVYGPFSVVWGLGCAMLTAFLYKYKGKKDRYIFVIGTVLGGTYEYLCSVFTELVFGTVFWDYSALPFNLGGRINLLYCFFWGIAAVVWLKFFYPLFSSWIERIPVKMGKVITWILFVFMLCNVAISGLALARYSQRQQDGTKAVTQLEALLDKRFPDERIEQIYPKAKVVDQK